jgi:hypothetical protein
MVKMQTSLMNGTWHCDSPSARISMSQPLMYADRLRIRQPGDATFALGPHLDGGSVERWEKDGYGLTGVYDAIFAGEWERYDPWDAASRVDVVSDLYNGLGSCSMLRLFQGWLSMSNCGPNQGTLLVNPLIRESTTYLMLRPFFRPVRDLADAADILDPDNWVFTAGSEMTSQLHGAIPSHGQELTDEMHPHLELAKTMTHMPDVKPGDYVAWHCDGKRYSKAVRYHPDQQGRGFS